MSFSSLTPDHACEVLARIGVRVRPDQVRVERRDDRWVAHLPGDRLAWFAATERGLARLTNERRVLKLLESRCHFQAPRVLGESADGAFDLRAMVPGMMDPWRIHARVHAEPELAARLGASIGAILAEQHTAIRAADVADWLPQEPDWPESSDWIRERLPRVMDDRALTTDIERVMGMYESVVVADADRALVHQDVGLHNLALDPSSVEVRGIFDYEAASWSDRHHDFRYLLFDRDRDEMLDAACGVYEPLVGHTISRERVALYNAACAITFLAYRAGTRPEEKSCGRTLAQDLGWTRNAIASVLGRNG